MTSTGRKTILVVDDEDDVRNYLSTVLVDAGYEVVTAPDGKKALELVRKSPPALVSLDISMPEMSGVRFYREMREDPALAKIPILIVTGVTNPWRSPAGEGTIGDFLAKRRHLPPPEGYFEKPVDREAYLATVARLESGT